MYPCFDNAFHVRYRQHFSLVYVICINIVLQAVQNFDDSNNSELTLDDFQFGCGGNYK